MYRPEGWENSYHPDASIVKGHNGKIIKPNTIFEAGADAMLEGLIKTKDKYRQYYDGAIVFWEPHYYRILKGTWVFIPSDD